MSLSYLIPQMVVIENWLDQHVTLRPNLSIAFQYASSLAQVTVRAFYPSSYAPEYAYGRSKVGRETLGLHIVSIG